MSIEAAAMVIVGAASILTGFGFIFFRERVAAKNKANLEQKLGRFFPGFGDESTPSRMAAVGVGMIFIGVLVWVKGSMG
ncbi:hypothetical protein [Leifsonia sp. 2MCAF36]|uniref:hypothetical protein n=1 Tax=Leifsonia sp. 2MCAF36 TaxID=3232988 RepID=UPI003F9B3B6E